MNLKWIFVPDLLRSKRVALLDITSVFVVFRSRLTMIGDWCQLWDHEASMSTSVFIDNIWYIFV